MQKHIEKIFRAGLQAVNPVTAIQKYCRRDKNTLIMDHAAYDLDQFKDIYIIGAGKAASPMAGAMESLLVEKLTHGIINVKYHHTSPLNTVKTIEAGHPVPDAHGRQGADAVLRLLKNTRKNDLVICLISGGASALLPMPAKGITLKDKQLVNTRLLASGATIHEINTIRKHISLIKGGRLAEAIHPSTLVTLILSDVVGDNLDVIGSGPTVPDSSTFNDCMDIIRKYHLTDTLPESVLQHLASGQAGEIPETPKPGDAIFSATQNIIIGSNIEAIRAAKKEAENLGYHPLILSSMIEGETRHVAKVHTAIAKEIKKTGNPIPSPACVLSGGETTVTRTGKGKGGRNMEFVLAAAMEIADHDGIQVFSAGTDGTDGPTDAAGATAGPDTMSKAEKHGMDPALYLENNDSYTFFKTIGDLVMTGPTKTNVMDLRIMLIR